MHHKIGTPVRVKAYAPEYNRLTGIVESRGGECYTIKLNNSTRIPEDHPHKLYGMYYCELEELSEDVDKQRIIDLENGLAEAIEELESW